MYIYIYILHIAPPEAHRRLAGRLGWEAAALTLNGIQGLLLVLGVEITQPLPDDQGQLDLVVEVHAAGTDDWSGTGEQDGRSGLEKVERLLRTSAVQLRDVIPIIARLFS